MYAALWRVLPGPVWVKVLLLVAIIAAVLAACVFWIFHWINQTFMLQDGAVDGGDE